MKRRIFIYIFWFLMNVIDEYFPGLHVGSICLEFHLSVSVVIYLEFDASLIRNVLPMSDVASIDLQHSCEEKSRPRNYFESQMSP